MTAIQQRAVDEAVPSEDVTPDPMPAVRAAREASVPTALPVLLPGNAPSPEQRAREWLQKQAGWVRGHATRILSGESLLHLDRPSVGATWAEHRKAAATHNAPVVQFLRLAYGVPHTGVTALVYVLLWATLYPAGLVITAVLLAAFIYWF